MVVYKTSIHSMKHKNWNWNIFLGIETFRFMIMISEKKRNFDWKNIIDKNIFLNIAKILQLEIG